MTQRKKLRQRLGCKNFRWYLDHVYPDIHIPDDRPGMFGMVRARQRAALAHSVLVAYVMFLGFFVLLPAEESRQEQPLF